ncbi:MAG: AEC family transporter [Caldicoprobacterales bacterium]|jgi:predicted permease|nr:AEC family transporter [Clostridiales bacterium]
MAAFLHIINNNIIPIFILIFLGFALNKKFKIDINTLTKANFYIFVPVFVFTNIYATKIPLEMLKVLFFAILVLIFNVIIGNLISAKMSYDTGKKFAFLNSILFYNSGNVGVPLITLVFSSTPYIIDGTTPYLNLALTTQITVLVVQNITTNTFGFFNAGRATLHWKDSIKNILTMPVIYAIPCALVLKLLPYDLTENPIWIGLEYVRNGMISIALITLGVQLSRTKFQIGNKDAYMAASIRLLGGPVIAFVLIKLMGFSGIIAQALMISTSVPTAVNSALIAVEYNNHPDFASQTVLITTVFSAITLSLVIYLSRIIFPVV